ncbi:YciI family protein [Pseudofulvimonas gallinarii]|jgi:hypothetical protein|uniref:YCII-related domain-containing protein n=1 Tax=Pseudofulvimonas gallinarii TaxID=634155 RepID=A0A4S3L0P4_9GAMM|nr:YciI family protein [Pseudofulvimonas gallinarii]TCS93701.1 hypothetical protein EDC25_12622 [Pseudofulvimonas gallinarii]THD14244.1 hypothetical protein B1808_04290 [Pseudofulvimonas gallinarii]
MKYLLLIYNDPDRLGAMRKEEFDRELAHCYERAHELMAEGRLLSSERLQLPDTATTVRIRDGAMSVTDGPFAETKEYLAGFNVIEARDLNEAIRLAAGFPWAKTGSVEVRPIAQSLP